MEHKIALAFRPLRDRVLVQRLEPEEMIGLLHVPGSAKNKSQRGKVIALGPGERTKDGILLTPDVKIGDTVLFGRYAGEDIANAHRIHLDGVEHVIMREDEIFAVLTGSEIIAP